MKVHRIPGFGFRENVYKEALEIKFKTQEIPFVREKLYRIEYEGKILRTKYPADFLVYDTIILEVKAASMIVHNFVLQTINYLKASDIQLGIIANFGQSSFVFKRIVF